MTGDEDGAWRPDAPVTRGELAAVLDRLEEENERMRSEGGTLRRCAGWGAERPHRHRSVPAGGVGE